MNSSAERAGACSRGARSSTSSSGTGSCDLAAEAEPLADPLRGLLDVGPRRLLVLVAPAPVLAAASGRRGRLVLPVDAPHQVREGDALGRGLLLLPPVAVLLRPSPRFESGNSL